MSHNKLDVAEYYKTPDNAKYDVLGIGNAIVDVLAKVDDDFLVNENITKGVMSLIDEDRAQSLLEKLSDKTECSGGSVANTVAALSSLGANAAFMGRVFDDRLGKSFHSDMQNTGVTFNTAPATDGKATASCVICVTPDAERTMSTFIGSCAEFSPNDVDKQMVADSGILYIEGYLWDQENAKEAIQKAIATAKRMGRKVAFSLSDLFCVERHREDFIKLVNESVDILFANEQEAVALHQNNSTEDALSQIGSVVELAAITCGDGGAWASHQGNNILVKADKIDNIVDTTGAGDLFATGFLCGLIRGYSIEECAKFGNYCAGSIIQQMGARPESALEYAA